MPTKAEVRAACREHLCVHIDERGNARVFGSPAVWDALGIDVRRILDDPAAQVIGGLITQEERRVLAVATELTTH